MLFRSYGAGDLEDKVRACTATDKRIKFFGVVPNEVVLQEIEQRWRNAVDDDPETFAVALKAAAETANARIHRYATEHPENRGMGTTATIAGLLGDTLYLCQVGDSRAYLVRDGIARQITKDQSLMQRLIEAGEITEAEAEQSDRRNIIQIGRASCRERV